MSRFLFQVISVGYAIIEKDFAKNSFNIHHKPNSSASRTIHPELL